jgi:Raf kinase inhibitor-like YbhB/YbcL family protein
MNHRKTNEYLRSVARCIVILMMAFAFVAWSQGRDKPKRGPTGFQLTTDAFSEGKQIPTEYTCDGSNASPPLNWTGAPAAAKSLALICEDKDAPKGVFVHWVIYNIPGATAGGLPGQLPPDPNLPSGVKQGKNGFNKTGYSGPCPSPGQSHRYFFRLYALDSLLEPAGLSRDDVDKAMKGHILAEKDLMGTY